MPLPDGALSIQGHSKPGDPLHTRPKQAMLVRMSSETYDALQNQPKMEFEFGDNAGIHIGDAFFPMRSSIEECPSEIYLRTSSAGKPMAPLKLYANVLGRFFVERELGEKIESLVRDRRIEAEKQRTERKAIFLDTPPDFGKGSATKQRKDAHSAHRRIGLTGPESRRNLSVPSSAQPTRVSSPRNVSVPSSGQPTRVASPLPSSSQRSDASPMRNRLVHLVASSQSLSTDDIVRRIGGPNCNATTRSDILRLLEQVAEHIPMPKKSNVTPQWQLKTASWTDVRPFEWPSLSTQERLRLARQARQAFQSLKIPESDPVWEYARYRDTAVGAGVPSLSTLDSSRNDTRPATPDPAGRSEMKRSITKETTQKKPKTTEGARKRDTEPIPAKDESVRSLKDAVSRGKERSSPASGAPTSASDAKTAVRKVPGSGLKTKATDASTAPMSSARAASPARRPKRPGLFDVREKREASVPSASAKPTSPMAPPMERRHTASSPLGSSIRVQKKTKETHIPSPLGAEVARDRDRTREKNTPPSVKRKKAAKEESDYSDEEEALSVSVKKRRKIEDAEALRAERERERDRKREPDGGRDRGQERSESARPIKREMSPSPTTLVKKSIKRDRSPSLLPPPKKVMKREGSPHAASYSRKSVKREDSPLPQAKKPMKREESPLPRSKAVKREESPPPSRRRDRSPPRSKAKREPSPGRLTDSTSRPSPLTSVARDEKPQQRRSSGSFKRRKSPVFTSSDDEDERPKQQQQQQQQQQPQPPKASPSKYTPRFRARTTPLPTDKQGLRQYYNKCYPQYIALFSDKARIVMKLKEKEQETDGDSITFSESELEGPIDMMDLEALKDFAADLRAYEEEIKKIQNAWHDLGYDSDEEL
ncbi:uncharacterized protein LAESUDRAFT_755424 [Laetiporus sulphureus 93-53]|uniref:RNA polymerase II elongation factor ELL N-terminal domain-containing protein n=1 Tax=Laetiporus sulphureus 93-53 TaxID=1314785 RepID=A0A165GSK1_9APHY|nr:uncharacterized protein LAESUDRAFT_755424 [Laetiporus sulphureus 93-53]KZT10750.1 hypothetical protein LAESUDRAFT_755424 [Laetiporus sulphureus 93-53]